MSKKIVSVKANKKLEKQIKVTQIGSVIGRTVDQERTLIGLGLNKLHKSRILEDTPCVRGMINKVLHLIKFEEL